MGQQAEVKLIITAWVRNIIDLAPGAFEDPGVIIGATVHSNVQGDRNAVLFDIEDVIAFFAVQGDTGCGGSFNIHRELNLYVDGVIASTSIHLQVPADGVHVDNIVFTVSLDVSQRSFGCGVDMEGVNAIAQVDIEGFKAYV